MKRDIGSSSFLREDRDRIFTSIAETVRRSFGWKHIELAKNFHLSRGQIKEIEQIIEGHYDELKCAWKEHFPD